MSSQYGGNNLHESDLIDSETRLAPILIVDDRPGNLLSLQTTLESLQQKIVHAKSGDEALRQVLLNDFAVILMDVRMPGLDGIKTAQFIRRRQRSAKVPIIFLTAVSIEPAEVVKAYEEGAVDFILKPFDPAVLRSKVKVFVELYLKEKMIKRQAALLTQHHREAFERRSEIRLRSVLDAMPIVVLALRPNGVVYYRNKTVADWVRAPLGEQRDSSLLEIVCPEDRERVSALWLDALSREQPLETQFRMQRSSDGAYRWYLCRIMPQRDEDGAIGSWICAATDIDRHHEAREEAESANRMKDEFLATVSHELRDPLNAILGWIHLLRTRSLDATKSLKALDIIERNARSQSALIDDILDIARITHGKLHLNIAPVDVSQVTETALSAARPLADSKEISLEYESPVGELLEVAGDTDRLQQVVWNLLSNAIKFTPRGGCVRVALRSDGREIELTVNDNGEGIRADSLPFIFDRFRQAESGSKRVHAGLGLGLAISRELIELQHGSISAHSEGEGSGATFTVRLPRSGDHDRSLHAGAEFASSVNLNEVKVLIVDDEADSREMVVELLSDYGAQAIGAGSAQEALETISIWRPDVLVSDIGMPFEDGYDLIRKVRALDLGEGGSIPACALTGWGGTREAERALAAGFQAHITKPLKSEPLTATIYRLAKGRLLAQQVPERPLKGHYTAEAATIRIRRAG
jgi:PAS domain S-box-containing protein